MSRACVYVKLAVGFVVLGVVMPVELRGDAFEEYALIGSFEMPQPYCAFDVLSDGRVIVLHLADVYVEDAVGTGTFTRHGTLPAADMPSPPDTWGAAFIRVSPDGSKFAVGNNGGAFPWDNFEVGIFDFPALTGDWYPIDHYDAEWYDNRHLAVTFGEFGSPGVVTALDTSSAPMSPVNPTLIENIDGLPGGVTFDPAGNLYTGNGYEGGGASGTGWIKVFDNAAWTPALTAGPALDFEVVGTLVVDILSAASLGFDGEGNLHVGGGDWFGGSGEINCAVLVRALAVTSALAGLGPADPNDPTEVRRLDPDQSVEDNFYTVGYNSVTRSLFLVDSWASNTVYAYTAPSEPIPTVSEWSVATMSLAVLTAGTVLIARQRSPVRGVLT